MITKSASFVTKGVDEDKRMVKGYASVFNNVDSDKDRLMKGSFNRTIKEWGPDGMKRIKLVSQHNINKPVGRIDVLKEDEKGLYMEAYFGTHADGEDHYRQVKEGILTEFSIGFVGTQKEDNEMGGIDFKQVKLYEVSLVTVAANDEALVTEVKSAETDMNRIEGMLKLVAKLDDSDVAFRIEKDLLKLRANAQEAANEVIAKESDLRQEAEAKEEYINQLTKLAEAFRTNKSLE